MFLEKGPSINVVILDEDGGAYQKWRYGVIFKAYKMVIRKERGSKTCITAQGSTQFFAAYKQISLIGSVPTKFTINSTTNWGLCLQAALACLPTLSGPVNLGV